MKNMMSGFIPTEFNNMKLEKLIKVVAPLLLMALYLAACETAADTDISPVIASVGNSSVTLDEAIEQIPDIILAQDSLAAITNFKEQWIKSQLKIQEADRIQIWNTPEFQKRMERQRVQLMENVLTEYILAEHSEQLEVTRDEAQNYFQAHKDKFVLDERYVRFRHVTTSTRTEAENARRDLMRGVSWNDVVNTYSLQSELKLRESSQFWPISVAAADIPMLNRYLNVIGLSEISPIYQFRGQFHFVQLMEERNEGDHPDFDWLIPQIEDWLRLEKSQRITKAFIRNLYLKAESNNEIKQMSATEISDYLKNLESDTP